MIMADWEDIERYRQLIRELGLPKEDFAIFGLRCPYCGKSDRINRLEKPEDLTPCPEEYFRLWERFGPQGDLVVCKFCEVLLVRDKDRNTATPLEQTD
jgi:hypothetical protein